MSKIKNILFFFYLITLLLSTINTQLTFLSPHSLSSLFINNTIDIEYGKVGPLTDFYIRGQIILENISPNKDACSSLTGINLRKNNSTAFDENFKILLAFAGSCPISQKARNAQNAGASMLIIINQENFLFNLNFIQEASNDIFIPIAFISNNNGKIINNYIMNYPNENIIVEINFKPKQKNIVDFKFFFSSSEPKAYELIGNMTKYMDNFGKQVNFTPYYVVHKNPYYVEENPNSNINCLSRGVHCYYPKETTITQEGQKILMEDIRQKCMFELNKDKDIKQYFKYLDTFARLCINVEKKSLTRECSKMTLKNLGYDEDYLDECVAKSFGVAQYSLSSNVYIEKNNKILEKEYKEILKYKLTSFPAIIINEKPMEGIIKEKSIVIELCNGVLEKPMFCSYFTGFTEEHRAQSEFRSFTIYLLIFLLIVINIGLFFMCRTYILEKLKDKVNIDNIDFEGRIKNMINNYFVLRGNNNNDYHQLENQSNNNPTQNEGQVFTV